MSSTLEAQWKKLTVPQLKALCKEKKITGYSKLGKNTIIQKLVEHASAGTNVDIGSLSAAAPTSVSETGEGTVVDAAPPLVVASSQLQVAVAVTADVVGSFNLESASVPLERRDGSSEACIDHDQTLQRNASGSEPTKSLVNQKNYENSRFPPIPSPAATSPLYSVFRPITSPLGTSSVTSGALTNDQPPSTSSGQLPLNNKRPLEASEPINPHARKHHKSSNFRESSSSAALHSVFKVPAVPASISKLNLSTTSILRACVAAAPQVTDPQVQTHTSPQPSTASSETKIPKRFVPLVVKKVASPSVPSDPPSPVQIDSTRVPSSLRYLDFPRSQPLSLNVISLPPSLSQRKQLDRLAILLSGISVDQLNECSQVSRLFRYAAYISAVHRLLRDFPGRRLELVMAKCSPKMTNMWPYLRVRQEELIERRRMYCDSFLGRVIHQGHISDRLWTSPDNDKQATVAVRFLLTRFFFSISIGTDVNDPGVVIDAQELVEGEMWSITARSSSSTNVWYVLEATCEVVGHPLLSTSPGLPLRADWWAYIQVESRTSQPPTSGRTTRLMEHLKWTNHEEYERGISKLWLQRIRTEGELGTAKFLVVERYILACVVSNSVSGRWMSSSEMAQEFNGLPSKVSSPKPNTRVHLFLPAHHHVESLHYTSLDSKPLHPALAAVRTPGREYYVLRDNGMQVGCEEEGIALVWRGLLGCDASGKPD